MFGIASLFILIGFVCFTVFGSGEVQPWNNVGRKMEAGVEQTESSLINDPM